MTEYGNTFADQLQKNIDEKLQGPHNCWNCKYMSTDSNCEPKCTFEGKAAESKFEWCSGWEPCKRLIELQQNK